MLKFLEGLLDNADSIAYGAGTELYNKMVQDTEDRHRKFTMWGDETINELNLRKKNLQEEETNYNKVDYNLIINIRPFSENYMGENKIKYRHLYLKN